MASMSPDSKIYIAGSSGLVGSALVRNLQTKGYRHLMTKSHQELDLTCQEHVERFFESERPEYVFVAAGFVGGIVANHSYPADFLYQNLQIASHVIHAAYRYGVKRLLFLGSSCIYPKYCPQPMKEEFLLTGPLEVTNEPYAVAKIAGVKMCQAYNRQYGTRFLSAMPTNLYGPGDNFDLHTSHVLPALIRKFHEGRKTGRPVTLWGTGEVHREFLHVDDCAEACVHLLNLPDAEFHRLVEDEVGPLVNVGSGHDILIRELAALVGEVTGFAGEVKWDDTKPDGTPRKLLDVSRLTALGWEPAISLRDGIIQTYRWYQAEGIRDTGQAVLFDKGIRGRQRQTHAGTA